MKTYNDPTVLDKKSPLSKQAQAANDLHQYMMQAHWNGSRVDGA